MEASGALDRSLRHKSPVVNERSSPSLPEQSNLRSLPMLLTGNYRRSLDEKLRLALPKPIREELGEQCLFLTPGTDRALVVYTGAVLDQIGQALGKLSPAAKEARSFSRLFYSQAQPAEVDRQGRLRIPPELAKLSGLSGEVVVVGLRDRIEIWNADGWDKFLQETQPTYDELAEHVLEEANRMRDSN